MLNQYPCYRCVAELVQKLSAAADEAASRAMAHHDEGPYRILTDELAEDYGFDREYIPLLTDMLRERLSGMDIEVIDYEIMMYSDIRRGRAPLSFTPERSRDLLDKALEWVGEMSGRAELYDTLKTVIGMTDEEIRGAGFELGDYFEESETDRVTEGVSPPDEQSAEPGAYQRM